MQQEMAPTTGPLAGMTVKCPTRVITYAWGEEYADTLLTLTLPALLAPGNLPYVASEVPCELVILTERRFFSKFDNHPTIARIRNVCPIRLVRLDDLIVSKDKYGMTLTYALHRAFSDLGPAMTEHWQIFLNADFILASGSLRSVIHHLSHGARIVASPSYCTIAEQVIPELRKRLDAATSILSVPPRELARLVLQNRHLVIQGKTINQTSFHMRYADQFYWSVDDSTLLGYQMPVSIVGLRPERYLTEPNSYWDFGLIWEYCPKSEVCVIGDSDEFLMMELREKSVAEDQVVLGPPNKQEIAARMGTWVTPYQQHFLNFPLTLHDRDLPPKIDDARVKLRSFVDEVMSNVPPLPSHIKHSQWEYHRHGFQDARRLSSRIRSSLGRILTRTVAPVTRSAEMILKFMLRPLLASPILILRLLRASSNLILRLLRASSKLILRAKQKAIELCRSVGMAVGHGYLNPALRRYGLEIIRSRTLSAIWTHANEEATRLKQEQLADQASIARLNQERLADQASIARLNQERLADQASIARLKQEQLADQASIARLMEKITDLEQGHAAIARLKQEQLADQASIARLTEKVTDLGNIATEYQFKLERS